MEAQSAPRSSIDSALADSPPATTAVLPDDGMPTLGYAPPASVADFSQLNTYSILSLVFAFIFAPVGIVFGALALGLSKVPGAPGWMKTVGTIGFWLSIAATALPLLLIIPALLFGFIAARGAISHGNPTATVCRTDLITGEQICFEPRGSMGTYP